MNHSMPGLPVHHQLPEFTQTHVHRISDAIQPSHHLLSPFPPAPNPSQHQSFPMSQLLSWGGQSIGVSALVSFLSKNTQGWSPLESPKYVVIIFHGLSFHRLRRIMSRRIIPTILGNHQGFPGTGPPPTFWPFKVGLGEYVTNVLQWVYTAAQGLVEVNHPLYWAYLILTN